MDFLSKFFLKTNNVSVRANNMLALGLFALSDGSYNDERSRILFWIPVTLQLSHLDPGWKLQNYAL